MTISCFFRVFFQQQKLFSSVVIFPPFLFSPKIEGAISKRVR